MNRSGFTILEVVIASALIVTLVTSATMGIRQVNLLNQFAATRTAHTELRTKIYDALADSSTCAVNLGQFSATPPTYSSGNPIIVPYIQQNFAGGPAMVVTDGQLLDGLRYQLRMNFPGTPSATPFHAGYGRLNQTNRYRAQLEILGKRESLAAQGGASTGLRAEIPLSVEFDSASGQMVSCTTNFEDMEEPLRGNLHTVRQCMAADGMPLPTPDGLICRIPVYGPLNPSIIPDCSTFGSAWQNAVAGTNYNTTVARDAALPACGGTAHFLTGWHYFSKTGIESQTKNVKKGQKKFLGIAAGGSSFIAAAFVGAVLGAFLGVFGIIIFLLLTKCKSESATMYSQVTGVGCV